MWKSNKFRGKKGKGLTPTQKAYIAGVKAGMARAGKYRRTSRSRRWY